MPQATRDSDAPPQVRQPEVAEEAPRDHRPSPQITDAVFELQDVSVSYSDVPAIIDVTFDIPRNEITAIIGPSGCGKSTLLRCLNRMNDLIGGAKVTGTILYNGEDVNAPDIDSAEVRRRIGMVFQRPNPFAKSIYDNVAYGPRLNGTPRSEIDGIVEQSLRNAALWGEVQNKLNENAFSLSGGQQQRLCIARALAVEPDVVLMDEPCSALDPIATQRIEDLMLELKSTYSILIVTHNMQQAARVSDRTAFFTTEVTSVAKKGTDIRFGRMVEYAPTTQLFQDPSDQRTEDYISGRFG